MFRPGAARFHHRATRRGDLNGPMGFEATCGETSSALWTASPNLTRADMFSDKDTHAERACAACRRAVCVCPSPIEKVSGKVKSGVDRRQAVTHSTGLHAFRFAVESTRS